jgi:predicted MPP superfamily phosphohydrolase
MNHGKNILVLSSWYPTQAQPFLGNFVEQQIELIATTNTVTVIVLEAVDNSAPVHIQDQQIKGYREIRIRYSRGKNVINRYFNQRKAFKRGFNLLDKVDLIHAHVLLPKGHLFSMAKKHFHLTLAGHTHGMQFGIEILGWLKFSPVQWRYPRWAGVYEEKGQYLNVNRGFGFLAYPGRVGIKPEIKVIELKRG